MDNRVKNVLRRSYYDIFYLMREKMIFENNSTDKIKSTICVLNAIERIAGEEPNTFFLEEKKGIKENGILNS